MNDDIDLRIRTTTEVVEDHLRQRANRDLEGDLRRNYAADVRIFSAAGIQPGHQGVRECAKALHRYLPEMSFEVSTRLVDGEIAYIEWSAESDKRKTSDGADSFVIRDGTIVVQTIHYTVDNKTSDVPR